MEGIDLMECPYFKQNTKKTILTGFLGGEYSGAFICDTNNKKK